MMQFAERHIKQCDTCRTDPDLSEEIGKIREFVLPESKIPKAERDEESDATPDISPDEDEMGTEEDNEEFEEDFDTEDLDEDEEE